jgi:hypothetical protein
VHGIDPFIAVAAGMCLVLPVVFAFCGKASINLLRRLALPLRLALPAWTALPYLLVAGSRGVLAPRWLLVYLLLPVFLVYLLWSAGNSDPEQCGNWRDFFVLLVLGVTVEFRLFEGAWPMHLGWFNRLILLDTGLYGFLVIRQLTNVGFTLCPKLSDWKHGLRELAFYAPIAVPLGLALGFLHWHAYLPGVLRFAKAWVSIFFLIALLEETYFRGWWQNLLERRIGRNGALLATAVLFGLSHFNKGTMAFNWRYVLLASLAGIFYGRAWRSEHRLFASAITHSLVDTIWLLWLR